jgi:hypothetical protein
MEALHALHTAFLARNFASILLCIEQAATLCTCRHCAEGEQVFLSYGPLPNLKLLLFYGFALRDNPQDLVSFTLQAGTLSQS